MCRCPCRKVVVLAGRLSSLRMSHGYAWPCCTCQNATSLSLTCSLMPSLSLSLQLLHLLPCALVEHL